MASKKKAFTTTVFLRSYNDKPGLQDLIEDAPETYDSLEDVKEDIDPERGESLYIYKVTATIEKVAVATTETKVVIKDI